MSRHKTPLYRRLRVLLCTLLFLGILSIGSIAPFLNTASATTFNPSAVSFMNRTTISGGEINGALQTCTPYFAQVVKSAQFLQTEFYDDIEALLSQGLDAYRDNSPLVNLHRLITKIGDFNLDDPAEYSQVRAIIQVGTETSVIKFEAAPAGTVPINGAYQSGGASICQGMNMIPVSTTQWRGFQTKIGDCRTCLGDDREYMTFTTTDTTGPNRIGNYSYHNYVPGSVGQVIRLPSPITSNGSFVVRGAPDLTTSGNGTVQVGNLDAAWVDAAHIRITTGLRTGEVYRKHVWSVDTVNGSSNWSLYFLESVTAQSDPAGIRAQHLWASGDGCTNPIATTVAGTGAPSGVCTTQNGGTTHCVPFIAVNQGISISTVNNDPGVFNVNTQLLQERINALGNADAILYDYDTSNCAFAGRTPTGKVANAGGAKIWLYYSATANSLVTVFTDGAANEDHYVGQYALGSGNIYTGPAAGCDSDMTVGVSTAGDLYSVVWTMTNGNCSTRVAFTPNLDVLALGGAAGEAAFTDTAGTINDNPNGAAGTEEPRIGCDFIQGNPLNWIVCPVIKAATNLVGYLDSAINQILTIDVNDVFDDTQQPGTAYHQAWAVFRTLALALIVIAALVMVIAQAAGVEILDAYTIRKVLPRILMAAIGITLSWEILEFTVTLSNDLGNGIRTLIYTPFQGLSSDSTGVGLANLSKSILALFEVGAVLAYGWFGLLSFVITAVLAVLVAFVVLTFRRILIIFLVIISPVAIAASILPNTQPLWKTCRNAYSGALMVFVIISAFIATGRVFSMTALLASTRNGTLDLGLSQGIAIIAYFIPYFLMPLAFRLAGGFVATIGGIVNDRSKGVFDTLKKSRSPAKRYEAFKKGELYNDKFLFSANRRGPLGSFARAANEYGERIGLGKRAGAFRAIPFVGGRLSKVQQRAAMMMGAERDETLRHNPELAQLANNDDANAVLALSGGHERGMREAAAQLFGNDAARSNQAMTAARAAGLNKQNASAALKTLAQNKSRPVGAGRVDVVRSGIERLAEGNNSVAQSAAYEFAYNSRQSGRADLGGHWNTEEVRRRGREISGRFGLSQQEGLAHATMLDSFARTDVSALLRGHDNQVIQSADTLKQLLSDPRATPADRLEAATRVLELQKGLGNGMASGGTQAVLNDQLFGPPAVDPVTGAVVGGGLGLDTTSANIVQQLADRVNAGTAAAYHITANELNARARVYDQDQEYLARMGVAGAGGAAGGGAPPPPAAGAGAP